MIERRQVQTPLGEMTDTTVICDACGERNELGFAGWDWSWARVYTGEYPGWSEWALCPRCKHIASWDRDDQAFRLPEEPC